MGLVSPSRLLSSCAAPSLPSSLGTRIAIAETVWNESRAPTQPTPRGRTSQPPALCTITLGVVSGPALESCISTHQAPTALAILINNRQKAGRSTLRGPTCGRCTRIKLSTGRLTGDLLTLCPAPAAALATPRRACVLRLRECKLLLPGCACLSQPHACRLLLLTPLQPARCDRCCRR